MRLAITPLRTALLYVLFGAVWIMGTDALVGWLVRDRADVLVAQSLKGLLYVLVSAALVYALAWRARRQAEQELAARLAAESRLRETGALQQALIEASPVALFSIDLEGRVLTWNEAARGIFGWSADEVIGRLLPVVPDEARDQFAELRARVGRGEGFSALEVQRRRKDGRRIDVRVSTAPIRDGEGRVTAIMAAVEDVTERKRTGAALQRSEQMLARAEAVAELGSWEWDVRTDTVHWSEELYRLFGLDPGDPPPPFAEHGRLFHPDDIGRLQDAVEAARTAGTPYAMELRARRADGTSFWGLARGRAEIGPDGSVTRLYGSFQDITRRKAQEIERERLRRAIEQAREAIVVTDTEGTIQYVNPAFERVTGYARSEAVGQNPRMLKSGEHDEAFYQAMWTTLHAGETWRGRIVNRRKDGRTYTEDMSISPVRDPAGEVVNYVAVKRDVTRELSLETQLAQSQKLEAIGRLAGGLAHDFNNMLTVILGHTDLALQDLDPSAPLREDLGEIREAAEHSRVLISQLLSFARKQVVAPQVFDLDAAIASRIGMLRRLIGEDVTLEVEAAGGLPPVRLDPGQLDQILTNLLVNARDAIRDVGQIAIRTGMATFDEEYAAEHTGFQAGDYVRLTVSDTGVGMDRETLDHVFEPFFTTKAPGEGTGLGLAMIYGIVKQNGGFINVYSEPGQGTTFKIYLPPASAEAGTHAAGTRRPSPVPTGSGTVLVVEDEPALLRLATAFLEKLGYLVLEAGDPRQALRLAREHTGGIDLVMTDVVMPEMNGRQLYEELSRIRPGIRCLFMSGYTADIIARRGVLEADVHFLQKPFSLQELGTAVQDVLRQ